ncbi:hypothetical protein ABPG75_005830 [Micractinium tetrahymenae]
MAPPKYAEAAHAAARAVEHDQIEPCLHPANAIVREFLLEVRRQRLANATSEALDQVVGTLKRTANALRYTHPYRVHDLQSAKKVHGCGPWMAQLVVDTLFAAYPPEPPGEEEREELARQEAAAKAEAAAQRKRKKQEKAAAEAAAADLPAPLPAPPAAPAHLVAGGGAGGEDDEEQEGQGRGKRARKAAPKEYVPRLGSAPFAFLIVMLQGQKGPARKQHFGKQELIDLAEASQLSDKPIKGDGTAQRRNPNGQQFSFDGWTGFRKQLVGKGLVAEWSNPKKLALTEMGLALAERLYRDAVARGIAQPIPGIPTEGPMLFQQDASDPAAAAAAAAAAGVPAGVLPFVALQASRLPAAAQQPPPPRTRPVQVQEQGAAPLLPPARASAGRGAVAAGQAALASYEFEEVAAEEGNYFSLPLSQRLRRQQTAQPPPPAQQQQQQQQQQPAVRVPMRGRRRSSDAHATGASPPAAAAKAGVRSPAGEVINLLSDSESPSPLVRRSRQAAAVGPAAAGGAAGVHVAAALAAAPAWQAAVPAEPDWQAALPPAAEVPDEQVAAMVGMGYSDKKARRALRKSLGETGLPDIGRAVELAELIDSEEGDSDAEQEQPAAALPQGAGQRQPSSAAQRATSAAAAAAAAAAARWESRGGEQQLLPGQLPPQRGWEQPPAPAPADRPRPATARLPAPTGAAPLALQQQQPQQRSGSGLGHIRLGSQQTLGHEGSGELSRQPSGAAAGAAAGAGQAFDVEGFLSELDRRTAGGAASAAAAGGAALARSGSGSDSGGSGAGGVSISIRQPGHEVRLPPLPPGRRFSEEYEVVLLLDLREQFGRAAGQGTAAARDGHMSTMRQAGLAVEGRQLPIGDAIWVARSRRRQAAVEFVLDHIVERKSTNDLVSSIAGKENRYEKQKYYLKRCGLRQVYYLIEGDPDLLETEQKQKMVRSAAATIEVGDGFTLLRTTDINTTFRLYQRMTASIQQRYQDLGPGSSAIGQLPSFAAWAEQCKLNAEGTLTLHDVWGMMLGAVKSLGPDAVQAILGRYPTPLHLYSAYKEAFDAAVQQRQDGHRAAERLLYGLKTSNGAKSIGLDKSAKVYQELFRKRVERGAGRFGEL